MFKLIIFVLLINPGDQLGPYGDGSEKARQFIIEGFKSEVHCNTELSLMKARAYKNTNVLYAHGKCFKQST